jgi:RNA polymerase sigma-70 factor (ECF subfamily)
MAPFERQWRWEGLSLIDDEAIREFLVATYPRLVAGVALIVGSNAAAEDAVQEALVRAWERSERGESVDSLPAWVTKVALNLSKSRLRRLRVEARIGRSLDVNAEQVPALTDHVDIERALKALPRRQREVTVLRYYLGLNVRETASALDVSAGTVKTSLFRARRALAVALGEPEPEEVDDGADHR